MKSRILYTKPSITETEIQYALDAVANGWGLRCYEYIQRFEAEFASHLNSSRCIATSSCTGALHMGLSALGIGLGDEVILADTNWIATAAPVTYLGAKPVFVDINESTWCIDPESVKRAITTRTKAIIATHLYGNLCDMNALLEIGEAHGIPVVEDAAEAIGSVYHGKRAGSMGRFGVFSFHGSKTISTGEGGMFVTDDVALYEKVLALSNHGRVSGQAKQFWPDMIGFKYKMSNVQAAIGCAQMERIESLISRKREILSEYRRGFIDLNGITLNYEQEGCTLGAWMPTIVFGEETGITRELLLSTFANENIDARVFFWPLSTLPFFEEVIHNRSSRKIAAHSINLPSFHDITSEEQNRVIDLVRKIYLKTLHT